MYTQTYWTAAADAIYCDGGNNWLYTDWRTNTLILLYEYIIQRGAKVKKKTT